MQFLPDDLFQALTAKRRTWLVTGAAGFIGSNLVECLLDAGQGVVGLDNYATGHERNLDEVRALLPAREANLRMIRGDIRKLADCEVAVEGVDIILHQAALGSVPRSIADPLTSHDVNVSGFVNMLDTARRANVRRFIYAASSSTYGDDTNLPKREDRIGNPLSPYAATKLVDEIYAGVYAKSFGIRATGLRYFNVFGPRQDPDGAYAAVIPRWTSAMIRNEPVTVFGDGETSRDFCFVANAVQANIRAALAGDDVQGAIFNVAAGNRTSLIQLFGLIRDKLQDHQVHYGSEPLFTDFRAGDVRHTEADIGKASRLLGYRPSHSIDSGLAEAIPWYLQRFRA